MSVLSADVIKHLDIDCRCRDWCRLPVVTPCRHLLCLSCVSLDCEKCPIADCGSKYKMQNPEDRARPENQNPKWPVPQDLIELQPSYVQVINEMKALSCSSFLTLMSEILTDMPVPEGFLTDMPLFFVTMLCLKGLG